MQGKGIDRVFYFILAGFLFFHLVVLNRVRILPFIDLPDHLAEATIYRYSGQPANQLEQYYPLKLFPYANVFYILFMGAPVFPSVEFGSKVFYSLYIFLLPVSISLLIRKLRGDVWFALLTFLYLYNCSVYWGLSGFMFFIPVFFLFYLALMQHMEHDRALTYILLAGLLMMIYFIHILGALFSLLVFFTTVIYLFRKSWRQILKKSLVSIPLLMMIFISTKHPGASGLGSYLLEYYIKNQHINLAYRVRELLVFDNFFLFGPNAGDNIAFFFSSFVMGSVILRHISLQKNLSPRKNDLSFRKLYPLVLCSLACFFMLPHAIPAHAAQYQRFSSLFYLSLIVLGSLFVRQSSRRFKLILCGVCFFHFVLWADCLLSFDKENRAFQRNFFPDETRDKILTGLIFNKNYRRLPVYIHFPSYYTVWRHGISATSTLQSVFVFTTNDLPRKNIPFYDEWVNRETPLEKKNFDVDYILVRGDIPSLYKNYINLHFKLFRSSGKWALYEKIKIPFSR